MRFFLQQLVLAVLLFFHAGLAFAQTPAPAQRHPQLDVFVAGGGSVDYLGNDQGLDGWVLIPPDGSLKTVYTTPQGGMVMGLLVDRDGKNKTAEQLAAYKTFLEGGQAALPGAEKSQASRSESVYAEVEKADWVAVGDAAAPYLYMFINVNCEHCQKFFKDLYPAVQSGQIQIRLLPFGKAEANRDGGAALLSSKDAGAAWRDYIAGDKTVLGKHNILPGTPEKVDANTALFGKHKMQGPPFTLYRRPADGQVTALIGRPANAMLVIADLQN